MGTSDRWNSALHTSPHREETPGGQGGLVLRFWASPPSTLESSCTQWMCVLLTELLGGPSGLRHVSRAFTLLEAESPPSFVSSLSPLSLLAPLIWSWPTVPSPFSPTDPFAPLHPTLTLTFHRPLNQACSWLQRPTSGSLYYATPSPYKEKWPWQITPGQMTKKKKFVGREVGCSIFSVLWTRVLLVSQHRQNLCFEGWISSRPPGHTVVLLSQSLGQSLLCVCLGTSSYGRAPQHQWLDPLSLKALGRLPHTHRCSVNLLLWTRVAGEGGGYSDAPYPPSWSPLNSVNSRSTAVSVVKLLHQLCFSSENPPIPLTELSAFFLGVGWVLRGPRPSLVAQLVKNPAAVLKNRVRSLRWKDTLEKGKATHSSTLAWRIPWTV